MGIPDIIIPVAYIRWMMAMLIVLQCGATYSDDALEKAKDLLLNLYPLVSRDPTTEENERIGSLGMLPHYLGGWGYDADK